MKSSYATIARTSNDARTSSNDTLAAVAVAVAPVILSYEEELAAAIAASANLVKPQAPAPTIPVQTRVRTNNQQAPQASQPPRVHNVLGRLLSPKSDTTEVQTPTKKTVESGFSKDPDAVNRTIGHFECIIGYLLTIRRSLDKKQQASDDAAIADIIRNTVVNSSSHPLFVSALGIYSHENPEVRAKKAVGLLLYIANVDVKNNVFMMDMIDNLIIYQLDKNIITVADAVTELVMLENGVLIK